MTRDASSGVALIVGAVAGLVTMSLHPTGRELATAVGHAAGPARLNLFVHALAVASLPALLFGAVGLTRRVAGAHTLATVALVTYALGAVAVLNAAVASGMIAPGLIARLVTADDAHRPALEAMLDYGWRFNQAFAAVFVAASSVAIVLWSAAILRGGGLPRWVGTFGAVVGAIILVALHTGHLQLGVHGFGFVVFAQAAWLIAVGVSLWRSAAPAAAHAPPGAA